MSKGMKADINNIIIEIKTPRISKIWKEYLLVSWLGISDSVEMYPNSNKELYIKLKLSKSN